MRQCCRLQGPPKQSEVIMFEDMITELEHENEMLKIKIETLEAELSYITSADESKAEDIIDKLAYCFLCTDYKDAAELKKRIAKELNLFMIGDTFVAC